MRVHRRNRTSWIGDPAAIKAKRIKKQKTDSKDAQQLLKLMTEDRFPRILVPSPENRDARQLLFWHRIDSCRCARGS